MHRLMNDFHANDGVRFLTTYGELLQVGVPCKVLASVDRRVNVGFPWTPDDV